MPRRLLSVLDTQSGRAGWVQDYFRCVIPSYICVLCEGEKLQVLL